MKFVEVRTQKELDKALSKKADDEIIVCMGNEYFEISGSAQVTAYGSAQVTAYGSAQVTAYGSAQVRASESAQVTASGSAQVTASGSAQVRAYGSAQVTASGSAQVTASESAQVTASESAQVTAYGSAQVTAYGSAQVTASKYVAVTKHGDYVKVDGGVLIEPPTRKTAEEWCEFYGVDVRADGIVVLYKAVRDDYKSQHQMSYAPGSTPEAPDWDPVPECGGGLHFCADPGAALGFDMYAKKFVACPVRLDEIVVHTPADYPNKVKAPRVVEPCYEVDVMGNRIEQKEAVTA